MDKEPSHMTERIIELTLEIVYLLSGENYIAFKISDGLVASNESQSTVAVPPPQSLTENNKKAPEDASKITKLLTRENYITFKFSNGLVASNSRKTQNSIESPSHSPRKNKKLSDVINEMVELLMGEEGQNLEGHSDLMMDNRPPLTLPDGFTNQNPPDRCPSPLCSRNAEHHSILQDDQVTLAIDCHDHRMEVKGKAEEPSVKADELYKEEEILLKISTSPDAVQRNIKVEGDEDINVVVKEEEIPVEIGTDSADTRATQRDVKAEEEEGGHVRVKEERCSLEISTDKQHDNPSMHLLPLENPTTPTLLLVLPSGDLSSIPTHGGSFTDPSAPIVHHPSARGGETFRCPECGECFTKRELLASHKSAHTKPSSDSDKELPRKLYVIEHELIPMKPYSCSECGKCFTQKGHVILHQRTHTGEKPYSCSECGKGFPAKSALSKHKRMHTGEKPFSCSECGKSFSFNSALTKHKKTHTGEKPYSCSDCGRCFSQRDHLIAHQKTHTGEKPFSCSECGKSFAKKGNLETHQTIHTGDRPYSCSVCGKGFRSKSNLLRHKKVHRGLKPHVCSECGKQFKTEFTLSLHLRSHETTGFTIVGCGQ